MMDSARILVIDDDRAVRTALDVNLSKQGMAVTTMDEPSEALKILEKDSFDLVMTDVQMPGMSGLSLLPKIKQVSPDTAVIVMTGYGSVQDAVEAMRNGASDYIIKPVQRAQLLFTIERALESRAMRAELAQLRRNVQNRYGFERLIGTSESMVKLYETIASIAETEATVLLQGPTGTGKELMANAIHYRSKRSSRPFVRVNCAAIPESLLESELFGHEKGAFTGAIRQHRGRFEQAHNGTLLLDEIGEIPLHVQVKLLRALENGEIQRVGGTHTLNVDVRIIAATNRDLLAESKSGAFRSDLYYRLNVVTLHIPALTERKDDIPLLADHFMRLYAKKNDKPPFEISETTMRGLCQYTWPGNVRELEHVIERAVLLSTGSALDIELPRDVPKPLNQAVIEKSCLPPLGQSIADELLIVEKEMVIAALQECQGVQARAARRLGISRSNLNYRINKLGIQLKSLQYE